MKRALAVGGATVGLVLGGVAAPASAAERLTFNDVSQGQEWGLDLPPQRYTAVSKLWRSGKQVGFGVINCKYLVQVRKVDCSYVASVAGGTVSVKLDRFDETTTHYTGRVVGGTGKYTGSRGTVVGDAIKNGAVVKIVINFTN